MQQPTAIIFDADHTLYTPQTERAYQEKFTFLAEKTGVTPEELRNAWEAVLDDVADSEVPAERERRQVITRTLKAVDVTADDELVNEAYDIFWEQIANDLSYTDDVAAMMRRLQEAGIRLAVASDEFPNALQLKLQTVFDDNVSQLFEIIVTPQETGVMKPSPRYYTVVLERFHVRPRDVVVAGDSWERDLEPADKLGMKTVLVADDVEGSPDLYLQTVTELEEYVLGA